MGFRQDFEPLALDELHGFAESRRAEGWRYVQTLATLTDEGIDLVYSFMRDGHLANYVVPIDRDAVVPSVSDVFLAAFVFENEIHDLFGVKVEGIAIDFLGNFYQLANEAPMTIISPEQAAAREKARKAAAAKAAKEAERTAGVESAQGTGAAPAAEEDLEAKLAGMDPEKAAKVRAAMEAKARKQVAAADAELEAKLAAMDPEKAAKVRAAMEAKAKRAAAQAEGGE